jgi:transcriptional regulator with XRE-family HTH domain
MNPTLAQGQQRLVKATRLRLVRQRKPYSQEELAALAKVSRNTIARIEAGFEAHPRTIRKLAEALGVEPHELMEDDQ